MKLRFLALTLLLASITIGARAQGGLYFNPIVSRVSISTPDTGPFAFLGPNSTSRIFGGVMIGGYYEVYHLPKVAISLDLRDEIEHGNSASLNSFLFGVRAAYKPQGSRYQPYAHLAIGAGRTASPVNPIHITKAEVAGFVGVDRPLNKFIDWRIVEIGYGNVSTVSSQTFSGQIIIPSANLFNVSTGFVFRLP